MKIDTVKRYVKFSPITAAIAALCPKIAGREAAKAAANIKTGGTFGAVTKRGPLNKYDNPAFVGQADLNSHILESFSKGIMEEEEKKKKEEQGEEPVNKRGYLRKEYSGEDIQREKSEAKEFLDDVARLNPTKGYTSESTPRVFDLDETNLPKKEGDVFDYSDRKSEKGKYSKQGKKWLRQSNKLVR